MPKTYRQLLGSNERGLVYVEYVAENQKKGRELLKKLRDSKMFFNIKEEPEFYTFYHRIVSYSREPIDRVRKRFPGAKLMR